MLKLLPALCAAVLLFAGCASPVTFSEALQMKVDDKVYTACNLWYEDAADMYDDIVSCIDPSLVDIVVK